MIDEAQHALTTDEGINALFSLKAARNTLNTDPGRYGMQLVATGSNRDKLATLVNGREQAFYGADMVPTWCSFQPLAKTMCNGWSAAPNSIWTLTRRPWFSIAWARGQSRFARH